MSHKIALIEDDLMLAEIYQTWLDIAGFDCRVANDGLSGLTLVKQEIPDLILLDLMLPQMSGDQVLTQIRQSDWGKNLRVIILTNISESEAPDSLKQLGFDRYIVKANIMHDELVKIVNEVLGKQTPQTT